MSDNDAEDRWARARREMVQTQLLARGIRDPRVLKAMTELPREKFMTPCFIEKAYEDCAVPIDLGQTISQPYIVARMTEALRIHPGGRILEVGTGSGYQTAVLRSLGAEVWSIERHAALRSDAEQRLKSLGLTGVHFIRGDGSLGCPEAAPFMGIVVTAATPRVPACLIAQLAEQGRMVIPVGNQETQTLLLVVRSDSRIVETPLISCRFVRLVGQNGWER